jgi:hypothetical protein
MTSTGLSLASLYEEQDDEASSVPPITWDRPRWNLPDYDRLKATDLKHELLLGRVSHRSGRRKPNNNVYVSLLTGFTCNVSEQAWNEVAAYLSPKNIDINTVRSRRFNRFPVPTCENSILNRFFAY